jgi:NADP-dependent 3-hydroxy acid dehydrogenase YdfG
LPFYQKNATIDKPKRKKYVIINVQGRWDTMYSGIQKIRIFNTTWSVYAAAKAGVLNFSKGMYLEMQPYGVRVSCVVPSSASTGFQSAAGIGETTDQLLPEDIAETVLYIANLPGRAVVEDVTVWGIDKQVNPL